MRLLERYAHDAAMLVQESHDFLEVFGGVKRRLWVAEEVAAEFAAF